MITVIYKCDRCGAEQTNSKQIFTVKISYQPEDQTYRTSSTDRAKVMWCRKCCDEFQIITDRPHDAKKEEVIPELTFEDKLREIIRQEIEEARR